MKRTLIFTVITLVFYATWVANIFYTKWHSSSSCCFPGFLCTKTDRRQKRFQPQMEGNRRKRIATNPGQFPSKSFSEHRSWGSFQVNCFTYHRSIRAGALKPMNKGRTRPTLVDLCQGWKISASWTKCGRNQWRKTSPFTYSAPISIPDLLMRAGDPKFAFWQHLE